MVLSWQEWRDVTRIQNAQRNSPSMKVGESGQSVHLLQAALVLNGFDIPFHGVTNGQQNNSYGPQTSNAVRQLERQFNLPTRDTGISGQEVVTKLDELCNTYYVSHAGHFGAVLARGDVPLAISKVAPALLALNFLRANALPSTVLPMVDEALRTHFRLLPPGTPGDGIRRERTINDLNRIILTYTQLSAVLNNATVSFRDGIPFNGVKTAAEADTGSSIVTFGPMFRDFDGPFFDKLGPHTRTAILIHEGTHAVDDTAPLGQLGRSGQDDVHISEFDPLYDTQTADRSILNPSSYASFAAHIANNGDPNPRFGLGERGRER